MPDSAVLDDSSPVLPRVPRRRWPWVVGGSAVLLTWLLYMPTEPLRLASGESYPTLKFDRNTSYVVDLRTGEREVSDYSEPPSA